MGDFDEMGLSPLTVVMPPTEFVDNAPLPLSSIKLLLGPGAGVGE